MRASPASGHETSTRIPSGKSLVLPDRGFRNASKTVRATVALTFGLAAATLSLADGSYGNDRARGRDFDRIANTSPERSSVLGEVQALDDDASGLNAVNEPTTRESGSPIDLRASRSCGTVDHGRLIGGGLSHGARTLQCGPAAPA